MTFKKNTGEVGIGTNSPLAKLDIYDTEAKIQIKQHLLNLGLGDNASEDYNLNQITFSFRSGGEDLYRHLIKTRHNSLTPHTMNAIDFYLWKNGQTKTDIGNTMGCQITAGGVGIGTTNPSAPLSI